MNTTRIAIFIDGAHLLCGLARLREQLRRLGELGAVRGANRVRAVLDDFAAGGQCLFARGVLRFERGHDFLRDGVEVGHGITSQR